MIEDPELRALFKAESDEHLSALEASLLAMEQGRGDPTTLDQVFRDAHSLKGAARMLELSDIEMLMHGMEEQLRFARDRREIPDATSLDALLSALDAVRTLSTDAVEGGDAKLELRGLMEALRTASSGPRAHPENQRAPQTAASQARLGNPSTQAQRSPTQSGDASLPADAAEALPAPTAHVPVQTDAATTGQAHRPDAQDRARQRDTESPQPEASPRATIHDVAQPYRIDTIRVATSQLDHLLRQCGELIVSHQRIADLDEYLQELVLSMETLERALGRINRRKTDSEDWRAILPEASQLALRVRERLREEGRHLEALTRALSDSVREARLLPLATLFELFPRMVRDMARDEGKQVELLMEGGATTADKHVVEQLKDPLMHILRNAVHHGIESPEQRRSVGKPEQGRIRLRAQRIGSTVRIEVDDDGRGVDVAQVQAALDRIGPDRLNVGERDDALATIEAGKLTQSQALDSLFRPGLSTERMITDVSGRGVGLDVVRNNVESLKGSIRVTSEAGRAFRLQLDLPITLATTQVLLVQIGEVRLGLPMDTVQTLMRLRPDAIYEADGGMVLDHDGQALSVIDLARALGLRSAARGPERPDHCIIIGKRERRVALLVDSIAGAQDVLLTPLGGVLRRVRGVAGTSILGSGEVCPILLANDLLGDDVLRTAQGDARQVLSGGGQGRAEPARRVLVVDDSMLTRVQEKRILEGAGYRVVTAVDGVDAWDRLQGQTGQGASSSAGAQRFDAVVTDVNMPHLDGLRLTERIRGHQRLRSLPVVLVTALASAEDQARGLHAGANAYITKGDFDNRLLLSTLERLI